MTSRFYRLPSLTALATFEALARRRSMKRAAEELNVTPGAVSRQIKGLEEELGIHLFGRSQSGMALTSEGETLYATLAEAFRRTADTVDAIRAGQPQRSVTLACTDAFAKCWLMPRMSDFWRNFPDASGVTVGCTFGVCGACKVRKLSGEIHMVHNDGISDEDIAEGHILVSRSRLIGTVSLDV